MTTTEFPVLKGTLVYVGCEQGYSFTSGDRVMTCKQDAEYTFTREPVCSVGMCSYFRFGYLLEMNHDCVKQRDGYFRSSYVTLTCQKTKRTSSVPNEQL